MHKGATVVVSIGDEQATMHVTEVFRTDSFVDSFVGKLMHSICEGGAGEELYLSMHDVTIVGGA